MKNNNNKYIFANKLRGLDDLPKWLGKENCLMIQTSS